MPAEAPLEMQARFLEMLGKLLIRASVQGMRLIVSSFYRTAEKQAALYTIGRRGIAGEKTITVCDGHNRISRHQTKTAVDLNAITLDNKLDYDFAGFEILGQFWKDMGGTWGGDWGQPGSSSPREIWHFDIR